MGILIRAQSTRREAGVKHRTVVDTWVPTHRKDRIDELTPRGWAEAQAASRASAIQAG